MMITCETPHRMWTVEGKIETVHARAPSLANSHVGIDDLSHLLAQYEGRWAKVRVELIEGPRPIEDGTTWDRFRSGITVAELKSKVGDEIKRMRALATEVRERVALLRETRASRYVTTIEEQCIETMADTMLVVCDQIEEFDRRLKRLE
jgi:hypothetical protein